MEQLWTNYLRLLMQWTMYCRKITTRNSATTDRKMERRRAMLATEATQIQLFSGLGDVIAMKVTSRMVNLSLEILFGMLPLEAANTWAVSYSRIKDSTRFVDLTPQSVPLNLKTRRTTRKTTARLFWTSQITAYAIVNHYIVCCGVILKAATMSVNVCGDE